MLANRMIQAAAASQANAKLYVDDVFSAYTYTGTGGAQTITNGIDLAGKGGLVWIKDRSRAAAGHQLVTGSLDSSLMLTTSGNQGYMTSTAANQSNAGSSGVTFNNNGFSLSTDTAHAFNNYYTTDGYVSWTFRKASKFFDIITYTGNGSASRYLDHDLGIVPGMVIMKPTSTTGNWIVGHVSQGNTNGRINTTGTFASNNGINMSNSTSTQIHVADYGWGSSDGVNVSGVTYVAYIFAHDTGTDGITQCGSFATDAGGVANVSLGWEPQFFLVKATNQSYDWFILDAVRGYTVGNSVALSANSSAVESSPGLYSHPGATGVKVTGFGNTVTYIYLAIRRPNKPPTLGTQVYKAIARTGTATTVAVTGVGFAPDVLLSARKSSGTYNNLFSGRMTGAVLNAGYALCTNTSDGETTASIVNNISSYDVDGMTVGAYGTQGQNASSINYIYNFFKRAPGVFDQVCWIGDGSGSNKSHNLTVKPELRIQKCRSHASDWEVVCTLTSNDYALKMNLTDAAAVGAAGAFSAGSSATVFNPTIYNPFDLSARTYVAYLFVTKSGISKVGSYTGDGSTGKIINCDFTTTARFVLIKRTDSAGDWYIWDTVRGITNGSNDPHISLNTAVAEVTTDNSIDPHSQGFMVNQVAATNINVNTATYIYLAIS